MRSYLILHGISNHRDPAHWQFQLAAELANRGHDVRYPGLPRPDHPDLGTWLRALDHELEMLRGETRTVVCHSLACLLWFRAAARRDGSAQADRLLLVSPPDSLRVPRAGAAFRLDAFDPDAVRASAREELAIICSDDDPYNPTGAQSMYGEPLGLRATVLPDAGHITPDEGYGRWQLAADWCLGGHTRPPRR